jgi:ankyrin repeat protein
MTLEAAAESGDIEMVKFLTARGAKINRRIDSEGNTLLHRIATSRDGKMVKAIIENGAEVDLPNDDGCSPLHLAARVGDRDVVEILLSYNANINLQDNDGFTPLSWAVMSGREGVVQFLTAHGALL